MCNPTVQDLIYVYYLSWALSFKLSLWFLLIIHGQLIPPEFKKCMFISCPFPEIIVYVSYIIFVFMGRNGKVFAFTSHDTTKLLESEKNNLCLAIYTLIQWQVTHCSSCLACLHNHGQTSFLHTIYQQAIWQ